MHQIPADTHVFYQTWWRNQMLGGQKPENQTWALSEMYVGKCCSSAVSLFWNSSQQLIWSPCSWFIEAFCKVKKLCLSYYLSSILITYTEWCERQRWAMIFPEVAQINQYWSAIPWCMATYRAWDLGLLEWWWHLERALLLKQFPPKIDSMELQSKSEHTHSQMFSLFFLSFLLPPMQILVSKPHKCTVLSVLLLGVGVMNIIWNPYGSVNNVAANTAPQPS